MRNNYYSDDKYSLEILAIVNDGYMAECLLKNFIGVTHITPGGIIYHESPKYEPLNTKGKALVMFNLHGSRHTATDYMYIDENSSNVAQALVDELSIRGINLLSEDD